MLHLVLFACMPSPLPRQVRSKLVRSYIPIVFGLPRISGGSAPVKPFSRPAQRSHCYGLQICQVAFATLYTRGFSSFVASAAAPIATGWSEPVPGRDFHPLWISTFSRRTEKFRLAAEPCCVSDYKSLMEFQGHTTTPQGWPQLEANLSEMKTSDSRTIRSVPQGNAFAVRRVLWTGTHGAAAALRILPS